MKVLLINAKMGPGSGSVGRIINDLYNGIIEQGSSCKIAYSRGNISTIPKDDQFIIGSNYDVYMHVALSRIFGSTGSYSKAATKKFIKWIKEFEPDIVHMHGNYGYYLNTGLLFSYLSKTEIKVVTTLHSCWDFTGHCCFFSEIQCQQWKHECRKCQLVKDYPQAYIFENVLHNFRKKKYEYSLLHNCTIVGPCDWMTNNAKESFLKEHSIETIYNGIDTNVFYPVHDDFSIINKDNINILCVANCWDRRKGLEDIIELSNIIPDDYQLTIVGLAKSQFNMFTKKENVYLIEKTTDINELVRLYSSSDVLFNPTYDDNYPTVNLESIACHTPVVTYNTGGSPDALQKGKFGIVIEQKDYDTLLSYARKIKFKEILIDFKDISFLDKKDMIAKYINLYKRLTAK